MGVITSPSERDVRRDSSATLSIVIPLYNEAGNIDELLRRITEVLTSLPVPPAAYEVVCIDDGSHDTTRVQLLDAAHRDPHIRVISLSRNFGHQVAATAGLDAARGDAVVLMDGDLQDPPELIAAFLERFRAGYDVVYATRRRRAGESRFKIITAAVFYRVVRRMTNVSIPLDTGDFRLMSRRVIEALRQTRERHRFIRGLVSWVGFNQTGVEYDRDPRYSGGTKYPVSKMLKFAIDGITGFSEVPLRIASYLGFFASGFAFVYAVIVLLLKFAHLNAPGYTSTMIAVLFLGGVQLIGIGILGEYIGRIYDEIKARPLYLIADSAGRGLSEDASPSKVLGTR
jgi:glycosyltransferase involved in cell wall biosynthesis